MMKRIIGQIIALLLVALVFAGPAAGVSASLAPAQGVAAPGWVGRPGALLPVAAGAKPAVPPTTLPVKAAVAPQKPLETQNQVVVRKPQAKNLVAKAAVTLPPAGGGEPALPPKLAPVPPTKAEGRSKGGKKRRVPVSSKRCEPQSLTYARQRSGIMSCRNGRENGPMTWFAAEKKAGRTSAEPTAGSVLILKGQGHGMPTGHVAYVEEVFSESPTTYRLVFSHTNYDRQCHLETNIEALYDRAAMTLDVRGGAWQRWGRGLKVAGFIRDNAVVADPPAATATASGVEEQTSQGQREVKPLGAELHPAELCL
ncbi:MAG: hypothetical protein HGA96_09545 [Desulfobulbaceae bacterium]|nr:hypothetical protein [Desulfobulbaceae bacterium]